MTEFLSFEERKIAEQQARQAQWAREAERWSKRGKLKQERKEGNFLVRVRELSDGTEITVKRWSRTKKLAEVEVRPPGEDTVVYRVNYSQGQPHWLKIEGGEPSDLPPASWEEEVDPTNAGIYRSQPTGDKD